METTLKSKLDEAKNLWKSKIEDLELQLSLGRKDAVDELEKRKRDFHKTISNLKARVHESEHLGKEKATELKAKLEELQVQLNLGKAETKEVYDEQKKQMDKTMNEVRHALKNFRKEAGEKFEDAESEFKENLEGFREKLDTFKVHYALGKADLKDEVEKRRKELQSNVNEIKQKLNQAEGVAESKWEDFKSEMSVSLNHAKKAFEGIVK